MSTNRNSKPKMLKSEDTMSTINTGHTVRPSTPDPKCSICLDDLHNECHTNACRHLFCYECLKRWSDIAQFCPLCKKNFSHIHHSFNNLGLFETYDVLLQPPTQYYEMFDDEMLDDEIPDEIIVVNEDLIMVSTMRGIFGDNGLGSNLDGVGQIHRMPTINTPINGQSRRTQVYVTNLWAEPLIDRASHISDITLAFYRDNPAQTNRLQLFILRDIVAIRNALRSNGHYRYSPVNTDINMSNLIMQSLTTYEIRDLHTLIFVREFMNEHAEHFCHELYNFANSSFEIFNYDLNVQYTQRPHDPNTVEINEISYNNDETNIEILSESSNSIESLNFPSIDQPSTSTGIRHSLNRPNNSFQSVNESLFARNHSSSDDDDSIIASRDSQISRTKSQDINDKSDNDIKNKSKIDYTFSQFFPAENVDNKQNKNKYTFDAFDCNLNVQHTHRPHETTTMDITENSYNNDENNIEILSESSQSIESLDFPSIDQPSTSTGIRHSLNRPNNSFQSVNDSLFTSNHSSSDDEDSIIVSRDFQISRTKCQDVNNKSDNDIKNKSKIDYSFSHFLPIENVNNKKIKKRTKNKNSYTFDAFDCNLNVQQIHRPHEPTTMDINKNSYNNDENNIKILSESSHSIESLNFPSMDQPSTSTGIRHSLNRPNNSFQSVNDSLFASNHSSSDDEDSIIVSRDFQISRTKCQDVNKSDNDIKNKSKIDYSFSQFFPAENVKKNKVKKKNNKYNKSKNKRIKKNE